MNSVQPSVDNDNLASLAEIVPELGRIASQIQKLLERDPQLTIPPIRQAALRSPRSEEARFASLLLKERRVREEMLGGDMFGEPAWDMLLDLFVAHEEGQRVSISSLCIAAATPATTAVRWIAHLSELGWVLRVTDPGDRRRVFVSLTPPMVEKLRALLQRWMQMRAAL